MKQLARLALIFLVALSLTACYASFSPISAASFTRWQVGQTQSSPQQLSAEQIAKLSAWLQNHQWNWHPITATFFPVTLLSLSHADGTSSSANLMSNILIVGKYQRQLSESEHHELCTIIGIPSQRALKP